MISPTKHERGAKLADTEVIQFRLSRHQANLTKEIRRKINEFTLHDGESLSRSVKTVITETASICLSHFFIYKSNKTGRKCEADKNLTIVCIKCSLLRFNSNSSSDCFVCLYLGLFIWAIYLCFVTALHFLSFIS